MAVTKKFSGPFFVRKFEASDATIVVDLGSDQTTIARAEFNRTRNFLFLRESDFHPEFEKYRLKPILKATDLNGLVIWLGSDPTIRPQGILKKIHQ